MNFLSTIRTLAKTIVLCSVFFLQFAAASTEFGGLQIENDSDLVRAVNDQRRVDFVEGGNVVVTKLLPDDNSGLKHQKWVVRLSNGKTVQAVYNSDMCPRVPLKTGDVIAIGGQFIWAKSGALIHWLHHDPRGQRPDGYVYVNGKYYCKN